MEAIITLVESSYTGNYYLQIQTTKCLTTTQISKKEAQIIAKEQGISIDKY